MEPETTEDQLRRRPRRRLRKDRVAVVLVMLLAFFGGLGYAIFDGSRGSSAWVRTLLPFGNGKINILVLGVDAREDDVGRSDTAFVVTVDPAEKKATMLSLPRDTRVKISGRGWDKLNHAYAFGGSRLSHTTVEELLGIPIDYTMTINIRGFVRMIDALGGVTISVEKRMYYTDPYDDDGGLIIDLRPGEQRMDGKAAIQYVRYRDEEGDIGRMARQQKFLQAVLRESVKPQNIIKLPELIREFVSTVKTDMPSGEMVKLIPLLNEAAKSGLQTESVAGKPLWIGEISYWAPDIKNLRLQVAQIQGMTADQQFQLASERLASEYQNSIPRDATASAPSATGKKGTDDAKTLTSEASKTADKGKVTEPVKNGGPTSGSGTAPGSGTGKTTDGKTGESRKEVNEPAGVVKKPAISESTGRL
ncbi:MAG TPA: LCP family protein [Patescibacteria group bacterium]|nr:LCP family protein [Patescibacteria group bacterium]